MPTELTAYVAGQIWLCDYPVRYSGLDFLARMTVLRIDDGTLVLHSPCDIDEKMKRDIESIGEVSAIVAPGSYHYFHVPSAQTAFPQAQTYICPGVERKVPDLQFDWILGERAPDVWAGSIEQVLVRGSKYIWEVAFFHKLSRTLVLVDLVENIGDETEGVSLGLKIWWKAVFHMWNKAKPAPEYQMGWNDKVAAARSLEKILQWPFERVVIAHGDLIEHDARTVVRTAWENPLKAVQR